MNTIKKTQAEWEKFKEAKKEINEKIKKKLVVVKDGPTYYFDVRDDDNETLAAVAVKTTGEKAFYSIYDEYDGQFSKEGSENAFAFLRENVIGALTNNTTYLLRFGYVSSKEDEEVTGDYVLNKVNEICEKLGKKPIDAEVDVAKEEKRKDAQLLSAATRDYMDNKDKVVEPGYDSLAESAFYQENGYVDPSDEEKMTLGLYNPEALN